MVRDDAGKIAAMNAFMDDGLGWRHRLHVLLRPDGATDFSVVDMYCGAGGLSLGFAALGFDVRGVEQ